MILTLEKDEVFLYDADNLTIVVIGMERDHKRLFAIKFDSLNQLSHFGEMIEFIKEKRKI